VCVRVCVCSCTRMCVCVHKCVYGHVSVCILLTHIPKTPQNYRSLLQKRPIKRDDILQKRPTCILYTYCEKHRSFHFGFGMCVCVFCLGVYECVV